MKAIDTRKYAIYSRKSKFTGKGESVENQIDKCKEIIRKSNPQVSDSDILVFEDEGFSGKDTNRPNYQEMMKLCRNKEIQAIVCYKLDRVSRSLSDFSGFMDELKKYNVSFISHSEDFDTTTPYGNAMMGIIATFAQLEREMIAERVRDNMLYLAKTGRWLGGTAPTGYKGKELTYTHDADGKLRKMHKLELIPEEAKLIRLIYSEFLQNNSLSKVETYCINNHIKTKNGKNFSRFAIKGILQNPVYLRADERAWEYFYKNGADLASRREEFDGKNGVSSYNKTIQGTGPSGKSNKLRDMEDWIITAGRHKPIIESEDWIKVQKLLEQNISKSFRKPRSNVALLSGRLYCKCCGSFMRPKMDHRTKDNTERRYHYLCEMKEKSRQEQCAMKNAQGNELDENVWNTIVKTLADPSVHIQDLAIARAKIAESTKDYSERLVMLQKNLIAKERTINHYFVQLESEPNETMYQYVSERIQKLHEERSELEDEIIALKSHLESKSLSESKFMETAKYILSIKDVYEDMDIESKRETIRKLVDRIEWDGERGQAHIYLLGSNSESHSPQISDHVYEELRHLHGEPLGADSK